MNLIKDIMTFAFRGKGKYLWVSCVVLTVVADLASLAPVLGLIAKILISGYFCAIYYQLIQSSATGGNEAPEFPDASDIFGDIISPLLQIIAVAVVSFGPCILYVNVVSPHEVQPLIAYALLGFGVVYFPMAMLAVVVLGRMAGISPHIVFPAIFHGGWVYWLGVGLFVILYILGNVIEAIFGRDLIIGHIIMAMVGSYTFMTQARILGIVYREREDELGWL